MRSAEQRREEQRVEKVQDKRNLGSYWSAFKGVYPLFTPLKLKRVCFKVVGEKLSYFSNSFLARLFGLLRKCVKVKSDRTK